MMQDEPNLSLFEVSTRLGVSPSAIKKRVAQLGLPVLRGPRGKLIFDRKAYALLVEADGLLKAGHGFEDCRRLLGLNGPAPLVVLDAPEVELEELPAAALAEPEAPIAEAAAPLEPTAEAPSPVEPIAEVPSPVAEAPAPVVAPEEAGVRPLPPPIFVQLGRKKPVTAPSPDLLARLDAALKMLEDKERHNQMLQAKLLVAYDEMTKLSATAAAFQERSLNLSHEIQKLQGELKMLEAPGKRRPWWTFWG
jgi:hypothetical protein